MKGLDLLLDSCRSEITRQHYKHYFKKYQAFMGADDLFCGKNPKLIEQKIIEFIMQLRKSGLSSNGILCYLAPVKSFLCY